MKISWEWQTRKVVLTRWQCSSCGKVVRVTSNEEATVRLPIGWDGSKTAPAGKPECVHRCPACIEKHRTAGGGDRG